MFRDPRSDFVTFLKIWDASLRAGSRSPGDPPETSPPETSPGVLEGRPIQEESGESKETGSPGPPSLEGTPWEVELKGWSGVRLRKFCRENFLSYRRMREWRDVHGEIRDILGEMGGFRVNDRPASYEGIHRAVLSGYLSHLAVRKEKNLYLGARNRRLMIFPGSGLLQPGRGLDRIRRSGSHIPTVREASGGRRTPVGRGPRETFVPVFLFRTSLGEK